MNFGYTGAGMVSKQAKATANRALRKAERLSMRGGGNAAKAGEKCFAKISEACFTGRMLIDVPEGKKQAKDIGLGDLVASRSEFDPSGLIEYKEVEKVFVRVSPIWNVHVASQVIETTPEHPFYAEGRGWIPAKELRIGDLLLTRDDRFVAVEGVADSGRVETVYNWRIAEWHTYFVSAVLDAASIWAHNASYASVKNGQNSIERGISKLKKMEAAPVNPDAAAAAHGYTQRTPEQRAPFNSMGESIYQHPRTGNYLTPDRTGHGGGIWKMFDRHGNRLGTFDGNLNYLRP